MTTTKSTSMTKNMPASTTAEPALPPTATYAQAYAVLNTIAERLRAGSTANIDELGADLRRARDAHSLCRARIAAIRAEIDREVAAAQADSEPAR